MKAGRRRRWSPPQMRRRASAGSPNPFSGPTQKRFHTIHLPSSLAAYSEVREGQSGRRNRLPNQSRSRNSGENGPDEQASHHRNQEAGERSQDQVVGPCTAFHVLGTNESLCGEEESEGGELAVGDVQDQDQPLYVADQAAVFELDGVDGECMLQVCRRFQWGHRASAVQNTADYESAAAHDKNEERSRDHAGRDKSFQGG